MDNTELKIALADFSAITPEQWQGLKGIMLAAFELMDEGVFTHEAEELSEPGASYQALGRRLSAWMREIKPNVQSLN